MRLWKALEQTLGERLEGFDFGGLAERADRQRSRVEELHLEAVAAAFRAGESAAARGSDPGQPGG